MVTLRDILMLSSGAGAMLLLALLFSFFGHSRWRRRASAEQDRRESEKSLLFDSMPIPILLYAPDCRFLRCNRAALALAPYPERRILADPYCCYRYFCGFEDRPEECPVWQTSKDQCSHSMSITLNGREFSVTSFPILADGKLLYILKTLVDMTEANEHQRQLREALTQAEQATRAKNVFLATMSHELRTPLNAVIGFSELLKKEPELEESRKFDYIDSIHTAGSALLNLINDILDLTRIEADKMPLLPQPTDIVALAGEIRDCFRETADAKGLTIELEPKPARLPTFLLDGMRLRQTLLNLVGNAVKFTPAGKVVLRIIHHADREELDIEIHDTGIGIAPEYLSEIFEPFVRQNAQRNNPILKGSGLGLAISQRLAEGMKGSIRAESAMGAGSVFTVHLTDVAVAEASRSTASAGKAGASRDAIRSVLVVDDVPMNLKVLCSMLTHLGLNVRTADSGEAALTMCRGKMPDLVLTDMWMEGIDGRETARRMRELPGGHRLKIAVVTADSAVGGEESSAVFDTILYKPITFAKLNEMLEFFRTRT